MHRRARGQRQLPQRRGSLSHVRPLGRGHGAGAGGHGVRIAALGEAQSECARRRRDRNRCGRGWCRRVDPGQHAARPCPRPRIGPPAARWRRRRPLGRRRPPRRRPRRLGVPVRLPGPAHRGRRRRGSPGRDAVELLQAGADAVQVGTATFRDPRAPWKVLRAAGALVRVARHDSAARCERRPDGPARRGRSGSVVRTRLGDRV